MSSVTEKLPRTGNSGGKSDHDRPYRDLREFLQRAERAGEVVRVPGASWDL